MTTAAHASFPSIPFQGAGRACVHLSLWPALPCSGHRLLGLGWKTQSQAVVLPLAWEAVGREGRRARPVPVVPE